MQLASSFLLVLRLVCLTSTGILEVDLLQTISVIFLPSYGLFFFFSAPSRYPTEIKGLGTGPTEIRISWKVSIQVLLFLLLMQLFVAASYPEPFEFHKRANANVHIIICCT